MSPIAEIRVDVEQRINLQCNNATLNSAIRNLGGANGGFDHGVARSCSWPTD